MNLCHPALEPREVHRSSDDAWVTASLDSEFSSLALEKQARGERRKRGKGGASVFLSELKLKLCCSQRTVILPPTISFQNFCSSKDVLPLSFTSEMEETIMAKVKPNWQLPTNILPCLLNWLSGSTKSLNWGDRRVYLKVLNQVLFYITFRCLICDLNHPLVLFVCHLLGCVCAAPRAEVSWSSLSPQKLQLETSQIW